MSDFAVIEAAGKQYLVRPGQTLRVPIQISEKKSHQFTDLISGRKVQATLVGSKRSPKISVRKFKSKARYLRRKSHRGVVTALLIDTIAK